MSNYLLQKTITACKLAAIAGKAITPPLLWNVAAAGAKRFSTAPLTQFSLQEVALESLFPKSESSQISMSVKQIRTHLWAMPEHELLVLGAIAKYLKPSYIIEFGTFTGASTLALAMNSPGNAKVVTVDIDPSERTVHQHGLGVGLLEFNVGMHFKLTNWESKIEQRFSNSASFDLPEWIGRVDLFFIDADHTYEFVRRDTEKAKSMLSPNGVIVWHDYRWDPQDSECEGVTRAVNEFSDNYGGCYQIQGTRFAIHINSSPE
jgi:predicted O-methyltransferase YrrM